MKYSYINSQKRTNLMSWFLRIKFNKVVVRILSTVIVFIALQSIGYSQSTPLNRNQLNKYVQQVLLETDQVFKWEEHDHIFSFSALLLSDSIASIGFKPINIQDFNRFSNTIDIGTDEWKAARMKVAQTFLDMTESKYGIDNVKYLFPYGLPEDRPYFNVRIFDLEILNAIKEMPEVRYLDPMGYSMDEDEVKSNSGCSNYASTVNPLDTTLISPNSSQSWHHLASNVDTAWTKCDAGDGIWIAIMDTGISEDQSKLNDDFDEGDSAGRTIEAYGFYDPGTGIDGWEDQCGHGTSMTGLAAAPRGFDDVPSGVAYRSNVISYRVSEDVVINSSAEKTGLSNALYDAADDTRVHIISISLGDVFSNNQVRDAIIYANNEGKLIFCAAGTSFSLTSWYGVIFPANMNETVAVTGIKDGSRTRCDACHSGSEVDFIIEMERSNDISRHGVSLAEADLEFGYVGGSSCATATQAGIAALVWGNNMSWDKNQVLNRLIITADNYPNRSNNFGWGIVDACAAVDTTYSQACIGSLSNEVELEITNISFPSTFDALTSEAEWVISLNGEKFFFDVDVNGASGNPASFINTGECGFIPMSIDLGTTACGATNLNFTVESFEDDGLVSDCDYDSGDDDFTSTTENADFNGSTFTHESTAGDFIFTYTLNCIATATPAASIIGDTTLCLNDPDRELIIYASGGTGAYTIEYTINGGSIMTVTTGIDNKASLFVPATTLGSYTYDLVSIEDVNGCNQSISGTATVIVDDLINAGLVDDGPSCPGDAIVFTATPPNQANYEFFHDANGNQIMDAGESLQSGVADSYTDSALMDGDTIGVIIMESGFCDDIAFVIVSIAPSSYNLTGTVSTVEDFETDGIIESVQLIDASGIVDYDSGTEVQLNIGFEVQIGATFCALIDGCNGGQGGVNAKEEAETEKEK